MKHQLLEFGLKYWRASFFKQARENISTRRLTIFLYHEINRAQLSHHLNFLQKRFEFISLSKVREWFLNGNKDNLPANPALLTFDDGFKSNYELLNTFRERNIRPTIFLTVGLVGTRRWIWTYIVKQSSKKFNNINLTTIQNKEKDTILNQRIGHFFEKEYSERQILTWDEVREMAPFVDFQSHSMSHPILTQCDDDELKWEFAMSKRILSEKLGEECDVFAYPNGLHDARVRRMAEISGYTLGREACIPGLNSTRTDKFALRRISIGPEADADTIDRLLCVAEAKTILNLANS